MKGDCWHREVKWREIIFINNQSITAFISCILLVSCAATETGPELGRDINYQGSDCISIRTIRDYEPLDSRNLLMTAGGNRSYFVTLASPAHQLRSAFRLGFSSRDQWLCPYGGDRIVFGGFSDFGFSIRSISRVTEEQAEELLIRYGKRPAGEQQDAGPPPDLKGADVEELG